MKCKSVFRKNIKFKCGQSSVISDFHLERIKKNYTHSFEGIPSEHFVLRTKLLSTKIHSNTHISAILLCGAVRYTAVPPSVIQLGRGNTKKKKKKEKLCESAAVGSKQNTYTRPRSPNWVKHFFFFFFCSEK